MPENIPILFDTDIGGDIDDAVTLAYLLRQPRCELLGITTVFAAPRQRAALADAVCRAAGRTDIPIHAGAADPLLIPAKHHTCPQAEILPRFDHTPPEDFPPHTAIPFMQRVIRERPGEIILLAVGPMTNLGLLFAMDPELPSLLRGIVLMCGDFGGQSVPGRYAEWNAECDPHAAYLTYEARGCDHLSIGLNVTTRCRMPAEEAATRFRELGGPLAVVAAATDVWRRRVPVITFHDPLAAAAIFEPDLIETQSCLIRVDRESPLVAGLTRWHPNAEEKPHRVAMDVHADRFFRHYFDTVA